MTDMRPVGAMAIWRVFSTVQDMALGLRFMRHQYSESSKAKFWPGQVVTVELGLYYPGIGGVRLEDDVLVTKGRPRNLTRFEKVLEV